MAEIVIFIVFIVGLAIGSLVAQARGRLPTAEELQIEDQQRAAGFRRTE
jgi:hypothetical protein